MFTISFLRSAFWVGIYFMLVAAPIFVMLIGYAPPGRGFWRELSIGFGFAGLSMMGTQFFLTGRLHNVTSPYGIDVVYHFHRNISLIAFLFILFHVVFLIVSSPKILILMNPLVSPWWMIAGTIGLLAFAVLIVTSLYRRKLGLTYERWRIIHGYLSVIAIVLSLSHIVGVGYYVHGHLKQYFWGALVTTWFLLLIYVRILKPLWMLRHPYIIEDIAKERGKSWTLTLRPEGHKGINFHPGQFAWLTIGKSPFSIREHPFSFSSSAMDTGKIQMTVKELGDFTSRIGEIPHGTRAYIEGPYGNFTIDRHPEPGYVFIVGGVGITPIMSMLRTLADRHDRRPLLLIYGSKTWEDTTFREEIDEIKNRLNLQVVYVIGKPSAEWNGETGMVTADIIARYLSDDRMEREYFICGPEPMQRAVKEALEKLGLPLERVQSESFNFV
jgi:predicted ferric reductase